MAEKEEWSKLLSSIVKLLECPVCLDTIGAPARQCTAGHLSCLSCMKQISKCSLCQKPFLQDRPVFVNNLLEVLPRSCSYRERGCREMLLAGSDHEDFCGFRSISCRYPFCGKKVTLCKIEEHYVTHDQQRLQIRTAKQDTWWNDFHLDKSRQRSIAVFLEGHFLYVDVCYESQEKAGMSIILEYFPVRPPKVEYYVNVKLENGDFLCHKSVKAVVRKGVDDRSGSEFVAEREEGRGDYRLKISKSFLEHLVDDKNYKLNFSYSFFKREIV